MYVGTTGLRFRLVSGRHLASCDAKGTWAWLWTLQKKAEDGERGRGGGGGRDDEAARGEKRSVLWRMRVVSSFTWEFLEAGGGRCIGDPECDSTSFASGIHGCRRVSQVLIDRVPAGRLEGRRGAEMAAPIRACFQQHRGRCGDRGVPRRFDTHKPWLSEGQDRGKWWIGSKDGHIAPLAGRFHHHAAAHPMQRRPRWAGRLFQRVG